LYIFYFLVKVFNNIIYKVAYLQLECTMYKSIALFIFIAWFVVWLWAVTVIDLHGFFARKSSYWTVATIRTHKITKPLIWIWMLLAIVWWAMFYQWQPIEWIILYHLIIALLLIINGIFLSLYISPYLLKKEKVWRDQELLPNKLQAAITISFIVSFLWRWSSLFLLVISVS
jgi:hypothetical protein